MSARARLSPGTSALGPLALVLGVALAVLLVASQGAALALPAAALVVLALLAVAATRWPVLATGLGLTTIGLLPVYAGRYLPGTKLGITPALVVTLALLPVALTRLSRWRPVPFDVAVAVLCLLQAVSYLLNFTGGLGAALGVGLYVALPYTVFRLLSVEEGFPVRAAATVVAVGGVAGGLAILEHAGMANPYFRLPASGYEYGDFASEQLRFGQIRSEAGFGHSIALGMFLALALVLAVALAVRTRHVTAQVALLASGALMLVGVVDTLSRGALLALALGLGLWFLLEVRRLRADHVLAALAIGLVLVLATPLYGKVTDLVGSKDTNVELSGQHRVAILDLVRDPDQFSLLGHKTRGEGGVTDAVESRTGLRSFDNAYALVYLSNGVLALVAFTGIGAFALRLVGAGGLTSVERAWVAALCAAAVNLLTVNLLTQFEDFFWLATAIGASAWQRLDARNDSVVRSPSDHA